MRIVALIFALFSLMFGFRLLVTALQAAISGKILVRNRGFRAKWQPAPNPGDAWKAAFRDGLMGLLLIALGVVLFT